jgi:hypothetical protein
MMLARAKPDFRRGRILAQNAKWREQAKRNGDQAFENTRFREMINFVAQ